MKTFSIVYTQAYAKNHKTFDVEANSAQEAKELFGYYLADNGYSFDVCIDAVVELVDV